MHPTRIKGVIMKKLILFAISIIIASASFAQMQDLKFNKIPEVTFPCRLNNPLDSTLSSVLYTPNELSIYCSKRAQSSISKAQGFFYAGVAATAVGGVIASVAVRNRYIIAGDIIMVGGAVSSILSVGNLIGHFKWEYRRKQVDLYLNPTGVTLKF